MSKIAVDINSASLPANTLTLEEMRRCIAELAGLPMRAVGDEDDLIAVGLDSIDVMKLASIWSGKGAQIQFGELLERRTLRDWWDLVSSRLALPAGSRQAAESDEGSPFELATMQHAYWFGRRHGQFLATSSHFYFEFDGEHIDPSRLEAAVRRLIERHPMLRVRFQEDGRQQVLANVPWQGIKVRDLRDLCEVDRAEELKRVREQESSRRLEVELALGFDVQLSFILPGLTRLHINIDMLVADAASFRIVISELAELYTLPERPLPPITYTFRQYLMDRKKQGAEERDRRYWAERVETFPGPPSLPLAMVRPKEIRSTRRDQKIPRAEWERLARQARKHGVTLAMMFLTAFAEVLAGWSTSSKFLLSVPLFDRQPLHPEVDRLVGDFTELLLLEANLSGECSFAERARRLQDQFRADVAHAGYSGVSVLRDLWRLSPDARSLAPVVFTSSLNMGELFCGLVTSSFGSLSWMISQTPQVSLDNQVVENEGELLANWDAVEGVFAEGVLDAMFGAYRGLLEWLGAEDSDWEGPLPELLPSEQRAVRALVNDTRGEESGRLLHERFFERAEREPERAAVLWDDVGHWSYGEVAGRALRLGALLKDRGVQPGDAVAVSLPKGPAQVVAVLGVLSAGGVYVPVGREQPETRRQRIFENAGIAVVVDEGVLEEANGFEPLTRVIKVSNETLAYIIYTSGSTGTPKGVEVTHRSAMNTIEAINDRYAVGCADRALAVSGLDFDLSVYDIFGLLTAGGSVVTLGEDGRRDARHWAEQVRRWGVTVWNTVPAVLDMLLTAARDDELQSLRVALVGGDWVGVDLPSRLAAHASGCRFVALGGATEAAIHSTLCEVLQPNPTWRAIPYGIPLRNVNCRVVDERGRDCPDWVTGELWIGGVGVAAGYRGNAEASASRFVSFKGERWYRTGDLGRYWPDGTLEFLGRADFQVKIRGHRIELGEIEAALEKHPNVNGAAAVAYGEGGQRLGAVVVGPLADAGGLREYLARLVPSYMVPERVITLEQMPLSANGKVDRKRIAELVALAEEPNTAGEESPRGEVELRLAEIWCELLGKAEISRQDSFFALGGDSLLATKLLVRLRSVGLVGANLRDLYEQPTLAPFAATLRFGQRHHPPQVLPDPAGRYNPFPMTQIQRAYWMGRCEEFALGGVGSYWYWEFDGSDVDISRLEDAWNRLIARHDMLRVVFDDDANQRVLAAVPRFLINVTDIEPGTENSAFRQLRATAETRQPLDLTKWPLFEIRALRYGGHHCRLGFGFDYIAFDALSIMTLFSELEALYRDIAASLPDIDVSFRDYVLGNAPSQDIEAAQDYWAARLKKLPAAPNLPVRNADKANPLRFTRRETRLGVAAWQRINERARCYNFTASTVLAAAYAEIVSTWSGGQHVTLNFTLFDRHDAHPHIHRVVGDFTSLMLVPYQPQANEGWTATAKRLQQEAWTSLEHRSVSGISVMRELAARSGATVALMPVVFTSTLGIAPHLARLSFPFGSYAGGVSQTPQVSLDNQVVENEGELLANWDAVEGVFAEGVLDAMFGAYRGLLEWLGAEDSDWEGPLPELLPSEQRAVRALVNDTRGEESGRLLHERFFERAEREPERAAVLWDDVGHWSYGEVAGRALRLGALLKDRGVQPGDAVAVSLPKGPAQVVAVLGVLSAGGVYVPVGREQPETRRQRIFENAGIAVVVDEGVLEEANGFEPLTRVIKVSNETLAYIIYTSGSTGTPKGVEVTHRSAMNTIEAINDRYAVGCADRALAVSGLDFDLSVYDIFGLLTAGGSVVTLGEDGRRDARHWAEQVRRWGVTVWNTVPAVLDMLLTAARDDELQSLRVALVGGDWVGVDLPSRLAAHASGCRFVALGGATEAAIWSNAFDVKMVCPQWTSIPYGYPLPNTKYRVVDERGRDCPDWVTGELWIGGVGVAAGYRGNAEASASRFVSFKGERWYRTGDLGRYWPDGTLEFLGRADFQVKIRGHRIELGEIEAALEKHPNVNGAAAVAYGEGGQRLGAVVVGPLADAGGLREYLARLVPSYMVPERVITLEQMPLSANGKVDRKRIAELVALAEEPITAGEESPRGEVELRLAEIWCELLGKAEISRQDSFFALGGDSLLATRLVQQARHRFGLDVSLRAVFSSLSLAELAAFVQNREHETETGLIA